MFIQSNAILERFALFFSCLWFLLARKFNEICCKVKIRADVVSSEVGEVIGVKVLKADKTIRFVFKNKYVRGGGLLAGGFTAAMLVAGVGIPNVIIVSPEKPKELIAIKTQTKARYSTEEKQLMVLAYRVGRELAGAPETIQAILLVETYAGRHGDRIGDRHLGIGKRSYGVMQVKVATARKVLRAYPKMVAKYFDKPITEVADEEIIAKLLNDDEFCIRIGTLNFVLEKQLVNNDWTRAVVAYNTGSVGLKFVDNPETFNYTQKIKQKIDQEIKPFNKEMKLGSK